MLVVGLGLDLFWVELLVCLLYAGFCVVCVVSLLFVTFETCYRLFTLSKDYLCFCEVLLYDLFCLFLRLM